MKKIQLGNWTIRTAKSLEIILLDAKQKAKKGSFNKTYWQMVGIYDTRIFGLVFYRNDPRKHELFDY